jgi:predicted nucleotidyltransferase
LATVPQLVCDWHGGAETETRDGHGHRPGHGPQKNLIERAYQLGEQLGLATWTEDEAGPYQTLPYPGESWQREGHPAQYPHEYVRHGTAKILTLFHPASGRVRVKGVTQSTNAILHPWLKEQLMDILHTLPGKPSLAPEDNQRLWQSWPITLSQSLPALRMLLIWDNLRGHYTPDTGSDPMAQTTPELKQIIRRFRLQLEKMGIHAEQVMLYGSQTSGNAQEGSDIDLIVISKDWGKFARRERLEILGIAAARILEPVQAQGFTPAEISRHEIMPFWEEILKEQAIAV